jgi:hypothetical protein
MQTRSVRDSLVRLGNRADLQASDPIQSPHASPKAAPKPQTDEDVFGGVQSDFNITESREKRILRWTGWASVACAKWSL